MMEDGAVATEAGADNCVSVGAGPLLRGALAINTGLPFDLALSAAAVGAAPDIGSGEKLFFGTTDVGETRAMEVFSFRLGAVTA